MPNYASPFGQAGELAGGTVGAGLGAGAGGLLGTIGGVLDAPRQSVYNLARGIGRGISGEGDWNDVLGAIPGALGAGLTGGLIASGVGAPLGIAAGSILGGLSQLGGKATGREAFNSPEVSDLTGTDEMLPNLLVGALTDPLTYAGGLGGAAKGAAMGERAGQGFGRGLEQAAIGKPLGYPGGPEKLAGVLEQAMGRNIDPLDLTPLMQHLESIRGNPKAMSEIVPGSTYGGHGRDTLTMIRPEGGVTQLTPGGGSPRVVVPEMLQADRAIVHGGPGDAMMRVEHSPRMDVFPHMAAPPGVESGVWDQAVVNADNEAYALSKKMKNNGVHFWDPHVGNVGFDPSGKMKIIDAGSIDPNFVLPDARAAGGIRQTDQMLPVAQDIAGAQPSALQSILLRLLGSDKAVQAELASKLGQKSVQGSPIMDALIARSQSPVKANPLERLRAAAIGFEPSPTFPM